MLEYVLLDSEGLSRAVRGDREIGTLLGKAQREKVVIATSAITLIEAYDQRVKRAAWHWTLSKIAVRPVTEAIAERAIELLTDTGLHGHRHAIDAVLAAIALEEPANVTILTSDEDDMRTLCGDRVTVVRL